MRKPSRSVSWRCPRFRQRVESHAGEYWWAVDPYFDESRHIKRVRLPGKADRWSFNASSPSSLPNTLDKARPLWQMHIVEDYEGGAAVIIRIHHAIGDGMALIGMILSLMDGGDQRVWMEHAKEEPPAWVSLPGIKTLQKSIVTLQKGIGVTAGLLKEARSLATHPAKTAKIGAGFAGELAWLLLMPEDSWTRFKGKPSGNKRVAWTAPIPLDEVKVAGKALGCTINDMLLASVAGALCEYLKGKGDPTEGVEVRALVPVDLRKSYEAGQLGNKFGIVGVELPVGIENPLKRLFEVHRRMQALKQSLEPPVTLGMFAILGYAPQMLQDRLFDMLIHRATAVMTNVPGPKTPLYLGGAEIKQVMFWVPQSGDIGMGVSILTYNGMVQFGLVTDAAMVPDPEAIIAHFRPQFDQLLYYVLMSSWGQADTDAADRPAGGKGASCTRIRGCSAAAQEAHPDEIGSSGGIATRAGTEQRSAGAQGAQIPACIAGAPKRHSGKIGCTGDSAGRTGAQQPSAGGQGTQIEARFTAASKSRSSKIER